MKQLTENTIEIFAIKLLKRLGYQYLYALDIVHDFDSPDLSNFEEVINPVFLKSQSIQIRTLEKMRDTLLPKLMSGEVRVTLDLTLY